MTIEAKIIQQVNQTLLVNTRHNSVIACFSNDSGVLNRVYDYSALRGIRITNLPYGALERR